MSKTPDDFPVPAGDMEDDVERLMADQEDLINSVIILGQLDLLEVVDSKPRWSDAQQALILRCAEQVKEWADS